MRGHIQKRGNGYRVEIHIGYDEQGKRIRHRQTLSTKKAAEKYMRAKLDELETEGGIRAKSLETLEAYLKRWLEVSAAPRVRQRTLEDYTEKLRGYVFETPLGRKPLATVTPSDIQELYASVQARVKASGRGNGVTSVKRLHAVLRSAINQAVKWRLLTQNVCLFVDLPKQNRADDPYGRQHKKEVLQTEDFPAFIQAALQEERLGAMWVLALQTGLRPGEYLGLQWADFGPNLRQFTVNRALVRVRTEDGQGWRFEEPKTRRSRRTVVLDTEVIFLLKQHRTQQNEERLAAGSAYEDHDLVFCNEIGGPLHQHNLSQRVFPRIIERAGLSGKLTPYSLRHSTATHLLRARENLKIVSELLGHSSISLTADVYSHVAPDMLEGAASKMGSAMFGMQ
ncbi:MAG: tyrosine-type recombinase/integrase [Vulcanimicrobiota bacterium]